MIPTILTAAAVYVATGIDYLIILILLFSQIKKGQAKHIWIGQYIGTAIIITASLLVAWRNPEPFDLETKVTSPVAFKQSLELLIDENVLQGHEIPIKIASLYGLYLTPKMLAEVCGVEPELFLDNNHSKVVLKIKDFKNKYSS